MTRQPLAQAESAARGGTAPPAGPPDGSALDGLPHARLWPSAPADDGAVPPLVFAVVDLETTGASAIYDRILEVAVVRVEAGEIVDRYTQLVDPRVAVPPFITRLTGIDSRMVRGKPAFADVAEAVRGALGDVPLVAHNASFDEAFLRHAFSRLGQKLPNEKLCTLRLARRLLPRLPSYRLDALTTYFGIAIRHRHRALGDAEATALVLLRLLDLAAERGISTLPDLLKLQGSPVGKKPRGVDESVIQALPSGHGVYILKDADGHVLYIGKSIHVRSRVREHLRGGSADQPRLRRRLARIVDVEGIACGSELEALFLESRLIKRYLPEANQQQRNDRDYPFIRVETADPYPRLEATRQPPTGDALLLGPFRRSGTVAVAVQTLVEHLGLRQCTDPLQPGMSACALLDLGKCLGPCVGAVEQDTYRAAVSRAVDTLEGQDASVLAELIARRDAVAEDLRFEDAATLRDRILAVEHVITVQERLRSVGERNLAIIAPSVQAADRELFIIRRGQVVGQVRLTRQTRVTTIARALEAAFAAGNSGAARVPTDAAHDAPAQAAPPDAPDAAAQPAAIIGRDKVDEMHLLDTWLQRNDDRLLTVPLDPAAPAAAAEAVQAAVRQPVARQAPKRRAS